MAKINTKANGGMARRLLKKLFMDNWTYFLCQMGDSESSQYFMTLMDKSQRMCGSVFPNPNNFGNKLEIVNLTEAEYEYLREMANEKEPEMELVFGRS